jgi:NAD(P)-dependent dehydrogenase (short-subunit alcohol dehydrogenase family)
MPTVLITGANRGLGLEFSRQYAAGGWKVIATCRNPIGLGALATVPGEIEVHGLDVTDNTQIARLSAELSYTKIDLLINNAGVYGPRDSDTDQHAWSEVMRVNTMAPLKVAQSFAPQVAAGGGGTIATVTSKMASMSDNTSGGAYIYRSSKAALNAVMVSLSQDLRADGIFVVVMHPGWVRTDMGGANGLIDPPESVAGMRGVLAGLSAPDSGGFFNYDGSRVPW